MGRIKACCWRASVLLCSVALLSMQSILVQAFTFAPGRYACGQFVRPASWPQAYLAPRDPRLHGLPGAGKVGRARSPKVSVSMREAAHDHSMAPKIHTMTAFAASKPTLANSFSSKVFHGVTFVLGLLGIFSGRLAVLLVLLLTVLFTAPSPASSNVLQPSHPQHMSQELAASTELREPGGEVSVLKRHGYKTVAVMSKTHDVVRESSSSEAAEDTPHSTPTPVAKAISTTEQEQGLAAFLKGLSGGKTEILAKSTMMNVVKVIVAVPLLALLARFALAIAMALPRSLFASKDCVAVKMIQVVCVGPQAEKLRTRLQELSFKRDELADRMRWAIRNDVTIKDAEKTVVEEADDCIGEAAVVRQAARMMLDANQKGGWVAGKVDINTWDISDVEDAQSSFFARCARVRDALDNAFMGANVGDSRPEVLQSSASVRRMRTQNQILRTERDKANEKLGRVSQRNERGAKGPVVTATPRSLDVQKQDTRSGTWDESGSLSQDEGDRAPPPFPPRPEYEEKARQRIGGNIDSLYGKDLGNAWDGDTGESMHGGDKEVEVGSGLDAVQAGQEGPRELQVEGQDDDKAPQKYFIATVIVAVVEKEGPEHAEDSSGVVSTPQALEQLRTVSPESLLSLELLWAPEEGDRWLKKAEVLESLSIQRDQGYSSVQRLDLYGNQALW